MADVQVAATTTTTIVELRRRFKAICEATN